MDGTVSKVLLWLAGFAGALFIRLLGSTVRIEEIDRPILDEARSRHGRVIFALLHGQILLGTYIARNETVVTIISRHRDGEIIFRIADRLGVRAVRGSSTRGGSAALFELTISDRFRDCSVVITPDGPRGPMGSVKRGVVQLAGLMGLPIVPVAIVSSSWWEFDSWDRFQVPRPFSRAVIQFGSPLVIDRYSDDEVIEEKRRELEKRLHLLNAEATRHLPDREPGRKFRVLIGSALDFLRGAVSAYLWRERERWWSIVFTVILYPFELVFRLSVALRNSLYRSGAVKTDRLPVPVVSVGNISVGGTGKTMFVIALSRLLTRKGYKVCVLTRGYRGRDRTALQVVSPDVINREIALELGDEPVLLARKLPRCVVIRGRDRFLSGLKAAAHYGCDVCVLDDGFQYRKLHRDLDIVLLHGENPFGTGLLLPAGNLRESPSSLRRADLVCECRRWGGTLDPDNGRGRIPPGIPRIRASIVPAGIRRLGSMTSEPAAGAIEGKKVLAFAGIGDPRSFRHLIDTGSPARVSYLFFPDHFRYDPESIEKLNRIYDSMDADVMVTTEKDAVKLQPDSFGNRPCCVITAEMVIDDGKEVLEELFTLLGGGVGDTAPRFQEADAT